MTILKQGIQVDVELRLPVKKLWEALLNIDSVAPKIAFRLSHKVVEGKGGVGSLRLVRFSDGRYEHETIRAIDHGTHTLVSTVVTGQDYDAVSHCYERTVSLSSGSNGTTTIARWRAEYSNPGFGSPSLLAGENVLSFLKALEEHLTSPGDNFPMTNGAEYPLERYSQGFTRRESRNTQ